jgi:DNA-binding transcriptional LysR family regulator
VAGSGWPRLGSLQRQYPGLDVRLSANNQISDLRADGIDLAIRYCPASAAPPLAVHLFDETIAPVANPSMGAHLVTTPEALAELPLIEFDDPRPWLHWRNWLGAQGYRQASRRGILRFNQYDQVIHAALAGQGVALGRLGTDPVVDRRRPTGGCCDGWCGHAQPQRLLADSRQ